MKHRIMHDAVEIAEEITVVTLITAIAVMITALVVFPEIVSWP